MPKAAVRKVKKQPQRTCVSCQRVSAKRELVRIVRSPEGLLSIDKTGKAAGRGAYLCSFRDCWLTALARKHLERALQISLTEQDCERIKAFALELPERGPSGEAGIAKG